MFTRQTQDRRDQRIAFGPRLKAAAAFAKKTLKSLVLVATAVKMATIVFRPFILVAALR